ncbi:MAG: hypothetical protein QOD41_1353 [Cryptosporangiaceae bacterium]|jgi:fucose 4-O-acetylase-like acetyltransferase|nr:hypothetical protein [Cryptosporangiaceae bacterium]
MPLTTPTAFPAGPALLQVPSAAGLAAATPASRDRYMDLLRVAAIAVVVTGHWLMATLTTGPGGVRAGNAIAELPGARYLTWVFQVMPVFFFVGGFAHATALRSLARRRGRYPDFVRARMSRLLRPTAVFLGIWATIAVSLEVSGLQHGIGLLASSVIVQPLWFIGVYLGVMALAPAMHAWHRRHGAAVPVVLLLAAAAVDLARFRYGIAGVANLNLAFVWLAVHQLGYLYADGILTRSRWTGPALAAGGLASVLALTTVSHLYPVSMVGLPGEPVSNMSPPTLALAAHAAWLIGLVLMVRRPVTRWLQRRRVWTAVVAANGVVMTTFLWHLSALFGLYAVTLALAVPLPAAGSATWLLTRPLWIGALAVITAGLVAVFRGAEKVPAPRRGQAVTIETTSRPDWQAVGRTVRAAAGSAAACAGVLGVALSGLDGLVAGRVSQVVGVPMTPAVALALLAGGWAMLAWHARSQPGRPSS